MAEREQLEQAIAHIESQRAILGDAAVEAAVAGLRQQLAALDTPGPPFLPPSGGDRGGEISPPAGRKDAISPPAGRMKGGKISSPAEEMKGEEITPPTTPLQGERKAVTIMFADLSGFTALAETLDPEVVRDLMNGCFERLVPVVEKYGGVVDKFIGDEIMALFGAPVAHENDPERALRAALEMMEALAAFNRRRGTDLGLHFGINTGLVVAGHLGTHERQEYSVLGDAVNLAARLEDASERGEIFVGPDTYRLAAPLFEFEPLEPMRVKGKAEPIRVYKLLRALAQPGRLRGLAGLESPMVGRDSELTALLELSAAMQGTGSTEPQGRVVLVTGEPGLGKSRLIAEWRATASDSGVRWAEARCLSYGQGLAYHLLIDLLRSLIGVPAAASEEETEAALSALTRELFGDAALDVYPYLGHLLSLHLKGEALERVRLLDPQALQAQYLAALRQLILALADQGPLALVFEDIHWADPSSTELLTKLLPLASEATLLFCFVTRHYHDTPGWRLVTFAREQMAEDLTELTLQTLSDNDSQRLIANLLAIEGLPEHMRTLILSKAEGNPLFVEEVIRMLIDRQAIVQEGDGWAAKREIETVDIPDNLQGLLLARIDRLPDDIKHTLRVAAVIGRQFSVKVLEEVQQSI